MLVPFILKKMYPHHKETIDNRIKWFEEFLSAITYICCFYGLYIYHTENDFEFLKCMGLSVLIESIIDMLFCRFELLLHHCMIIPFYYYIYSINNHHHTLPQVYMTLITMETSTIFITTRNILNCDELKGFQQRLKSETFDTVISYLKPANDLCFMCMFYYARVYLYTKNIILNDAFFSFYGNPGVTFAFYVFYALNLYWFAIILKKGFRLLKHIQFSALTIENTLQYTCFGYFAISLISYYPYNNWNYVFDLGGQFTLAVTSYNYHKSIHQKLQTTYPNIEFDNLDDSVLPYYQIDVYTIVMRNCMNTITQLGILSPDITHYYILSLLGIDKYNFVYRMFFFHGAFAIACVLYLQYLKSNHIRFSYTENHGPKYLIISTLASFPIVVSVICGIINAIAMDYRIGVFYGLSLYSMILIRLINVGYGLNHILFHFSYAATAYCAVISNKQLLN